MFGCLDTSTYLRNKLMLGSKRKYPVHPINSKREKFGKYNLLQNELKDLNETDLVSKRMDKYADMGVYKE